MKVGAVRGTPNGLGSVWVQCPVMVANKIVAADRIQISWIMAGVEIHAPSNVLNAWNGYTCSPTAVAELIAVNDATDAETLAMWPRIARSLPSAQSVRTWGDPQITERACAPAPKKHRKRLKVGGAVRMTATTVAKKTADAPVAAVSQTKEGPAVKQRAYKPGPKSSKRTIEDRGTESDPGSYLNLSKRSIKESEQKEEEKAQMDVDIAMT